jgi:MFS family permease
VVGRDPGAADRRLAVLPFLPDGTLPLTTQLVIVYAVVVLSTIVSLFFTPARFTIVADIVPEDDQPRAASITQATVAAASIVGPPLAAPLLFTAGVRWSLILNALSFVFSFAMIWNVRDPRTPAPATEVKAGFWREFVIGLRTIVRTRLVLTMVIMGMIANVAAQTFNALGVFFVQTNLHTEAKYFGLQETAMGIGALVGATAAGWIAGRLGLARTVWVSMLLFGVFLGIYARMTSFPVALGVLLLAAITLGAMNTPVGPLLMRSVPREVLGRVFATFAPVIQSVGIMGVAIAGWLSSSALRDLDTNLLGFHFGTYDTLLLAAGLIVILSGLYGMTNLRNLPTSPSADGGPEATATAVG